MSLDWALICIVMSQSTCNKIVLKCMGINGSHPLSATEINYMYAFQQLDEGFTIVRLVSSYVTSRGMYMLSAAVFQTVSMTCRHTDTWSPSWPATTPVSTAPVPTPSYAVSQSCAPTETSPVGTPSGRGRDAVNLSVPVSRLVNNHFVRALLFQ